MSTLAERLIVSAHIAIIFQTFLLGVVLIKNYWRCVKDVETSERRQQRVRPVARISVPDADRAQKRRTLILDLSRAGRCRKERTPVYQKISKQRQWKNPKTIAFLTHDYMSRPEYLNTPAVGRVSRKSHHLLRNRHPPLQPSTDSFTE